MPIETIYRNDHCEWIDVEAPTENDLIFLHERYDINMLFLQDTIDPNHLPKYEQDAKVKFFLMRENTELERNSLNTISDISTKLGIFLFPKLIITVHRMRNRSIYEFRKEVYLEENNEITADKMVLDLALKVLKSYDDESQNLLEKMDNMENEIFLKNTNNTHQIRRLFTLKRKSGLNTRILNMSGDWVSKIKTLNVEDAEVTDLMDTYKDAMEDFEHLNNQISSLISMFLALSDQKSNQVMKVLAIYSMYFFPITFIAGIYGMNFQFMPELAHQYGYFITLGVMTIIALLTFLYVRKKHW